MSEPSENYWLQRLPATHVVDRERYLKDACTGKSVLHVGCADAEVLDRRIDRDELLHARIASVAGSVAGLDIDEGALEKMRALGFDDLHQGSAENLEAVRTLAGRTFEVVVAGEVIEHLPNPGLFLVGVQRLMSPGARLIVTTPNGLRYGDMLPALARAEVVHPNHVATFTPATLSALLNLCGLSVSGVRVYRVPEHVRVQKGNAGERIARSIYWLLDWLLTNRLMTRLFPYTADGLIVEATSTDPTR